VVGFEQEKLEGLYIESHRIEGVTLESGQYGKAAAQ
jgi:hypothetical protein